MPKYVIEREMPGVGGLSADELRSASRTSCDVLDGLGTGVQWVHSYVTADRIYCVYNAANEGLVHEHARLTGFPATRVSEVKGIIDPTTADASVYVSATQ